MGLWDLVILLIVAGICGGVGQAIAGYSHAGCLGSIALGFIGALLGMWIARMAAAGTVCRADRRQFVSDHLVDHRLGHFCRRIGAAAAPTADVVEPHHGPAFAIRPDGWWYDGRS